MHPVPDSLYPDEPDARRFTEILDWAANWFNVLPLPEAVERLRAGSLPDRAAAITFDDGYADNCVVALPILRQHGMHATFFVATAFMDGGRMFNDTVIEAVRRVATSEFDLEAREARGLSNRIARRERETVEAISTGSRTCLKASGTTAVNAIKVLPGFLCRTISMISDEQVRRLRDAGMEIGAHTRTHPSSRDANLRSRSRSPTGATYRRVAGTPSARFSLTPTETRAGLLVARGHGEAAGVRGCRLDVAGRRQDRRHAFELPRSTPRARQRLLFGLRLVQNEANRKRPARKRAIGVSSSGAVASEKRIGTPGAAGLDSAAVPPLAGLRPRDPGPQVIAKLRRLVGLQPGLLILLGLK